MTYRLPFPYRRPRPYGDKTPHEAAAEVFAFYARYLYDDAGDAVRASIRADGVPVRCVRSPAAVADLSRVAVSTDRDTYRGENWEVRLESRP